MTAAPQSFQQNTDGLRQAEVQSMDIWQAYAAVQEELREANASLKIYRDTNHVLRETLRVVRGALERARPHIRMSHGGDVQSDADLRAVDEAVESARALSQAPVTDGKRTPADLTSDELNKFATDAFNEAARKATAGGSNG
jgi:hypothetical protein